MLKNGIMLQGFEWHLDADGKFWKKITELASEWQEAGIDGVWLPPFTKGQSIFDVGYGIYDLYDLGEFGQKDTVPTKYGTREELETMIHALHDHDIAVYADLVMNHKAGADEEETFEAIQVDENQRQETIGDVHEIRAWTKFNFPGRGDKYSDFKWNHTHFIGVDYDSLNDVNGIFRIVGEGKGWAKGVTSEKGNDDYLMFADIDHRHPKVKEEFFKWSDWLRDTLNIDGFRLDALKHIDSAFVDEFIDHVREYGDDNFYLFGEYWLNHPEQTNKYLYDTKYDLDLFDVGLHFNLYTAAKQGQDYDLRKIFDNSLVKAHPLIAITFVDNHDSQPGQSLESFVEPWFKKIAYGLILLRKDGYPCIFYGDYYGIAGEHSQEGHKAVIDNLMWIRKTFAYGEENDYFEDPQLIGWTRMGNDEHPGSLAVLISNGEEGALKMYVGKEMAGKVYKDHTGAQEDTVTIDDEGYGEFHVGPGDLSAWAEVK